MRLHHCSLTRLIKINYPAKTLFSLLHSNRFKFLIFSIPVRRRSPSIVTARIRDAASGNGVLCKRMFTRVQHEMIIDAFKSRCELWLIMTGVPSHVESEVEVEVKVGAEADAEANSDVRQNDCTWLTSRSSQSAIGIKTSDRGV